MCDSLHALETELLTCVFHQIKHILKTNFENYVKGPIVHKLLFDLLGNGIFNSGHIE